MASLPPTIPSSASQCVSGVPLRTCTQPNNFLADCLSAEVDLWGRIAFDPAFPLLKVPTRYRALPNHPFDVMPVDAIRVNALPTTPTILSNMTAGRLTPIVSYLVPPGFDGVINSTLNKFVPQTAPALQDGSGMLTWLLQINNYLAIGYDRITLQMGDTPTLGPIAHDGGIRIKANDLIQFYAILSTAGAAFLDPNGIVLAAFQGWIYPNR